MNQTVITPDQVINTLNELIELNRDGQNGFQEAAGKVEDPQIKAFCLKQSLLRAKFVGELQSEVRSMGAEPDTTGSIAGALHRGWMDLKSALGGGDHAILAATETGEDHAITQYTKALKETLPAPVREMVELQFQSVKQTHSQVKELRNSQDK
jgi:uncharacterized protein (TIGR02284 family)